MNMYFVNVLFMTIIIPLISSFVECLSNNGIYFSWIIIEKWFVVWAVGLRLCVAGLIQLFYPRFTLEKIFKSADMRAQGLVRELGVHNLIIGVGALLSGLFHYHIFLVELIAGIFFLAAGILHFTTRNKSGNQYIAMVSDFIIASLLFIFLMMRS